MSKWNHMVGTDYDGLNWKCRFYFIFLKAIKRFNAGLKTDAVVPEKQFIFFIWPDG